MSSRRHAFAAHPAGGFTILELMVAMSLMAALTVIVYTTWSRISNHMFTQQRNSAIRMECGRILGEISGRIRGADVVIRWDGASVRFATSGGSDTITYSFDGTVLRKNEDPIQIITPQTVVKDFTIENLNSEDGASPFLFKITLTLLHHYGGEITEQATVLGRRSDTPDNGNDFIW